MRTFLLIFIVSFFCSCAKNPNTERSDAIDIALTHLSNGDCQEAIDVLEDVENENSDAVYLQVLASAYACKADFNEINFISNDLRNINTISFATIMTSLSKMSYSPEILPDSTNSTAILTGINILQDSTSTAGQDARTTQFGARKAGDMGVQALMLNLVNLGKFLNFYGNVNAAGAKGLGATNSNTCFIDYVDGDAQAVIGGGSGGICNVNNDGHPDLDYSTTAGKRRMCEGLMYLTNAFDILDNIDLSGSTDLVVLEQVAARITVVKTAAETASGGRLLALINTLSQDSCETQMNVSTLNMQFLFSLVFETGLQ